MHSGAISGPIDAEADIKIIGRPIQNGGTPQQSALGISALIRESIQLKSRTIAQRRDQKRENTLSATMGLFTVATKSLREKLPVVKSTSALRSFTGLLVMYFTAPALVFLPYKVP